MKDKHLEQDELEILRGLSRLPAFGPSQGFADRVMARVRLPEPRAVLAGRRARAWVMQPKRALALAGAYAACVVVALGVAVPWLLQHSTVIAWSADVVSGYLLGVARDTGMAVAGWLASSRSLEALRSVPFLREHLVAILAVLTVAYAGAGIALHHLLKAPGGKRVQVSPTL